MTVRAFVVRGIVTHPMIVLLFKLSTMHGSGAASEHDYPNCPHNRSDRPCLNAQRHEVPHAYGESSESHVLVKAQPDFAFLSSGWRS